MISLSIGIAAAAAVAVTPAAEPANFNPPAVSAPVNAAPVQQPVETVERWVLKSRHADWGVICNTAQTNQCRAIQDITYTADGNDKGRLLQLAFATTNKQPILFVKFPLGVDLRAGTALQIGSAPEIRGVYVTCMPDGCQSFFQITPPHQAEMLKVKTMKIGFRPIALGNKTVVLESSLEKFDEVLAALGG